MRGKTAAARAATTADGATLRATTERRKDDLNAPFSPKSNPVLTADGDGGPKLLTL